MDFIQRLDSECNKRGTTVTALLKSLNMSPNKGTNWRRGTSPTGDDLIMISKSLSLSVDYLLTGKTNSIRLTSKEKKLLSTFRQLPQDEQNRFIGRMEEISDRYNEVQMRRNAIKLSSVNIYEEAAGAGASTPFSNDEMYTEYQFPSDVIPAGTDCGIKVNGNSMEPDYPDGSIVWVNQTAEIRYGDYVIAILNGAPYFKIYERDGLHSINPEYDVIRVGSEDSFKIFGKVIGSYNSDEEVTVAARSTDNSPSRSQYADISELYSANKSTDEY